MVLKSSFKYLCFHSGFSHFHVHCAGRVRYNVYGISYPIWYFPWEWVILHVRFRFLHDVSMSYVLARTVDGLLICGQLFLYMSDFS